MERTKNTFPVLLVALLLPMAANAGLIVIETQEELDAAGNITQHINWDTNVTQQPGWEKKHRTKFLQPGDPFTVGDITFVSGKRSSIGGIDAYRMDRALLTDDAVLGTTALIANRYDLLGFNAGNFRGSSTALFSIVTDVATYDFHFDVLTYRDHGTLTFFGFQATGGEYIKSFAWSGPGATGLTDIQIGTATAVPEPGTLALFGIGLAGIGLARLRKKA